MMVPTMLGSSAKGTLSYRSGCENSLSAFMEYLVHWLTRLQQNQFVTSLFSFTHQVIPMSSTR